MHSPLCLKLVATDRSTALPIALLHQLGELFQQAVLIRIAASTAASAASAAVRILLHPWGKRLLFQRFPASVPSLSRQKDCLYIETAQKGAFNGFPHRP
jgi:hypothetical protein